MRNLTAAAALALLLALVVPALALGDGAFAVGGGQTFPDYTGFGFSAHVGPDGDVHGHMSTGITLGPPFTKVAELTIDVTCLTVVDNRATIGGVVTHVNRPKGKGEPAPPVEEGQGELFVVADNGNPDEGQPVDQMSFLQVLPAPPFICPLPTPLTTPIGRGNITVSDGTQD